MLFQAFLVGLTPSQRKLKLYPLALSTLWDQGGQIGPKRLRLHKWLSDNDFNLAKTVELGSNLSPTPKIPARRSRKAGPSPRA
jgi:hypothetical protein